MKAGHFDLSGSWTSRNKNAVFFAEIQIRCKFFSSGLRGKPLLPLWEIGSKKNHNFPIKSSHLCRTSRHAWLSSSACDHCCAYQLICIMTISTYSTGARAEMTRQLGSCTVKNRVLACILVATGPGPRQIEVTSLHFVL